MHINKHTYGQWGTARHVNSVYFSGWGVNLAVQTVVLCLQGCDVGPQPDFDNPSAFYNHLQPATRLHSAEPSPRMHACHMESQQCGGNT